MILIQGKYCKSDACLLTAFFLYLPLGSHFYINILPQAYYKCFIRNSDNDPGMLKSKNKTKMSKLQKKTV